MTLARVAVIGDQAQPFSEPDMLLRFLTREFLSPLMLMVSGKGTRGLKKFLLKPEYFQTSNYKLMKSNITIPQFPSTTHEASALGL